MIGIITAFKVGVKDVGFVRVQVLSETREFPFAEESITT